MNCVNCSLDNLINYIVNKYNINRKTATSIFYKLRNAVKNKLTCGDYVCIGKLWNRYFRTRS